ncbi:MAG TPA: FAD-dependent oxidoreductase, partial [Pyrinomonadaceae bacterium]|nr:FAD-dependent oxidoreductase [Pyrinomonadaceae bacterium]
MTWTRRELLTTFLGAPIALAACGRNAPRAFPEGEIVGANWQLGHVLREGRSFEVATDKWQRVRVAIVGAGVAGLAAAWQIKRKGVNDFVVLELEKEAGGTSRSGEGSTVGYPWGAHYLPVPFRENTELIELIE